MPLPANTTLPLTGLPPEGDHMYLRPKHAMIVRMSAETFDALDQLADSKKLEVQFGETPGFTIGETFFPVKPSAENPQNHELYLRLPNIGKGKVAPLKLHANVMHKLMVERELDNRVQESVRDRTLVAEKQRTERKIMYLDKPPDLSYPGSKGKKKDASVRRTAATSSRTSTLPTSSHPSSRASPLHTSIHTTASSSRSVPSSADHASSSKMSPLPTNANGTSNDTRARLVHCLAIKSRTTAEAVTLCAGKDPTQRMKNEIMSLLQAIAVRVPVPRNSEPEAPRWQLKLESWREVQPYEWPSLTDDERTHLARQARKAYQDLHIHSSDPLWDSARFRSSDVPASGLSSKSTSGARAPAEKNGVVMTKNTMKKSKTTESTRKKVSDIMIPAKDESNKGKARDLDESSAAGTPTSASRPPVRRQPGSGYKAKHSATPPIVSSVRANSPLPPIPKKSGPVDARESKREPPAPSGSAKPQPPIPPPQTNDSRSSASASASSSMRRKVKDGQSTSSHRSDDRREDRRDERGSERAREREREEKLRAVKAAAASPLPPPLPSFKRKKPPQDGNDSEFSEREVPLSASSSKKRKLEEPQPSPAEKSRGRDLSLPKKPVVREPSPLGPPRTKVKQEASPLSIAFSPPRASLPPKPPAADRPLPSSSSSSSVKSSKDSQHARSSSNKPRRKSPIYTSSEDESEPSVVPSRSRTSQRAHSPSEEPPAKRLKATHTPRFKPRPLPTDSAGLRKYYHTCWRVWHDLYEDHDQRRKRIERMLGNGEGDVVDATDDDMDVDELSPDVVIGFMEDLTAVTKELHKVRKAYEQLGGKSDALGELVDVC
ncbi:hypothetical protein L226DRAFT_558566 [Lentinus tigrinus ALCF2SS1-7]|uniref:RNA polymerase II elongation factor ELL N-terminal domain-containing protein n=1 Tax=Lentinus tigrinus ALCF2SS1-6 TaxID=1328759 RepID=A0A5C2S2C2_9APHY|nr:hypothetical protein L227DRAFT_551949 [Lentinus tigrinus ALCF2SS1-6]RPD78783.1 hypothetical protein L226DRAFT_558566 [Lentinus tigrinus ALCF2SS1-7]